MQHSQKVGEHWLPKAIGFVLAGLLHVSPSILTAEEATAISASPLPASAVDTLPMAIDASTKQKLMASGSFSSFFQEQPKVDLCPNQAASADITRALNTLKPNIGIQLLVVAIMPAGLVARTDHDLRLYNLIQQFRTMEGIPYFSATRGKTRIFFTASHLVKGPSDRSILSDPHYASIEPAHDYYVEQNDTTFGKNLYVVTVKGLEGSATELTMSNVDQVKYGFIPVLGPSALKLTMVIQPSSDGKYLYFYGNVGLKATSVMGMEKTVRNSFYNRIVALYNWFAKQAASA